MKPVAANLGAAVAPRRSWVHWIRRSYPGGLLLADVAAWSVGPVVAYAVRNGGVPKSVTTALSLGALGAALMLAFGSIVGIYSSRWRIATFPESLAVAATWAVSTGFLIIINGALLERPHDAITLAFATQFSLIVMLACRSLWRAIKQIVSRADTSGRQRVIVFGAGNTGEQVVSSMLSDANSPFTPVRVLDDDVRLKKRLVEGIPVTGGRENIVRLSDEADILLIAMPSADADTVDEVTQLGRRAGFEVLTMPSMGEMVGLMASIDLARPVEIKDLLGRDEVEIDRESVRAYIEGACVLVTGAGGSIGSEICRQLSRFEPARMVMLDRDETGLLTTQMSIAGHGLLDDPNLVVANIRDRERMFEVFREYRPTVVFHAAALKHLSLLETHPREGLLTNVMGSKNVLDAAASVGVTHYVNVSTDKAANPTSVLGTTKRLAEVLTLETGNREPGEYVSVRFGNVLASRGSVVPIFEELIRKGGPVTVTHPDVTRYFMSIPEASRLVLQAGAFGKTSETLVLKMGEPMKIVELAEKLIRHHNSRAEIVFTGLRPNEKLHEVLAHDGEEMRDGPHERIWHADAVLWRDGSLDLDELLSVPGRELPERLLTETSRLISRDELGSDIAASSRPAS